jgi:hypothetical protein
MSNRERLTILNNFKTNFNMKKLFLLFLMVAGFTSIQAQATLQYQIHNGSAVNDWKMKMVNAGPSAITYHYIAAGDTDTGTVSNFMFPNKWKAKNSNGCTASNIDYVPVGATTGPTSCPGVTYEYKIVQTAPLFYVFKIQFE